MTPMIPITTTMISPTVRALLLGLAMIPGLMAHAQPGGQFPDTLEAALDAVVTRLTPAQRSIIRGTARDSLFMLITEWGEDIEETLGFAQGNADLATTVCGHECSSEEATLAIMAMAWESLRP